MSSSLPEQPKPPQTLTIKGLGFRVTTQRLLSSSFLGLPYRILIINHKKELLRSLWVG